MLTPFRPLRVAILSSRRCPGASELLSDPERGSRWDLVCAVKTEEEFDFRDFDRFVSAKIPVLSHGVRSFHRSRGAPLSDLSVRRESDEALAATLAPFRPDLLFFSSYLYVATSPLLDLAQRRVVNIHGSDLDLLGADGRPRYTGIRAVSDAILCGESETRATAHWVTDEVDVGPVIVRSRPFPVALLVPALLARGDRRAVKAYAHAHQEWMLHEAWGPLWRSVLRCVLAGRRSPGRSSSAAAEFPRLAIAGARP